MLTKGAVEDIIMEHVSRYTGSVAAPVIRKVPELGKKVFLSDWELRRMYKEGAPSVRVPANAILSPLSLDWLDYNSVKIVRG